ncbi:LacI family DNA-binding transcriptional regulator [Rhizobium oryziradicis]|uniref:LacI family transcriptional regulator n=1 Tax=Rhizobium oryziradicis TaxID=1867956 RepID=A0A1Q8ZXA8_9HYPH|nr:LacI family DNA-binding transcriptional regulator [Rhizobium oryziradicis]OLP46563.1 LacI family transcriptional regulator [Rhizobium oryziradicis]
MKPTVHSIAAHAGVSLATVDRVLNARPGVRAATRARVEAAVEALGFVRDVAAANLAKSRIYPFTFILPANDNSFMRELRRQVLDAASRAGVERTRIDIVDVPAFDGAALVAALQQVAETGPAGVALVAVDAPEVAEAVAQLRQSGVPVVTLVSDLSSTERDHFAGIDNIAAGRTAASLLGRFLSGRSGSVAILAGSMLVRDHRERFEGFCAVMATEFPSLTLLPVLEGLDDPLRVEVLLREQFASHDILGLYSLGAGNRGLVRALETLEVSKRPSVIAHELTQTTRAALEVGLVDAVLNQDAGHEVRSTIRVLKAKADGAAVVAAQERIRLDIFLKDNLP